jgi:two-component system, sensor histidine kinase and response regulator
MTIKPSIQGSGRILFVDDDPFYRDIANETLTSAGYDVTAVDGGAQAIVELNKTSFDLMVLDLSMPGVSGFNVLEHVRQVRKLPDLPVLVITGHDDGDSVLRAFDMGATSFLAKPLNWVLFVHHVEFVLKAARAQTQLRDASRSAEFMSDLKSRLVGTLVTEFQAPLRSAYGFARLLKEETDGPIISPLYQAWIDDLHRAVEKLNTTHLKMLNFGRALAENINLNEEVVDIAPLLDSILRITRDAAMRRSIRIRLTAVLPPLFEVRVDRVLLAQALRGVLEYAVMFSSRNTEILITVKTQDDEPFLLEIQDTAPRLAASQIDEILGLKSFATARPETVEASTSLKMSRVLMEAHQGSMRLAPRGDGMLTELLLPRSRIVQEPMANQSVARLQSVAAALQAAIRAPAELHQRKI